MAILRLYNLVSLISTEWRIAWPTHLFTCHCFHIYHLLLGVYRPGCGTVPRVKSRSWSPPEVVGRIDLVDVHGGHSSCGSVTGASRFLIGLVSGMCAAGERLDVRWSGPGTERVPIIVDRNRRQAKVSIHDDASAPFRARRCGPASARALFPAAPARPQDFQTAPGDPRPDGGRRWCGLRRARSAGRRRARSGPGWPPATPGQKTPTRGSEYASLSPQDQARRRAVRSRTR